ncbi:hypothetical protein BRADI_1g75599v3, partial [Brachypodium distachyon]
NVRGLNTPARRAYTRRLINQLNCSVLCLQETKLAVVSPTLRLDIAGPRLSGCADRLTAGTRGGIMILWDPDHFHDTVLDVGEFSLTIQLAPCTGEAPWCITSVYGPNDDPSRLRFLQELRRIRTLFALPWLAVGDFNLIVTAEDKSSTNLNRKMMRHF